MSAWVGKIGEYELFEVYRETSDSKKYTLESIIYTSWEKAIYSYFTFKECEDKAYRILQQYLETLLCDDGIERVRLTKKGKGFHDIERE